jgi:flavorubredoxin
MTMVRMAPAVPGLSCWSHLILRWLGCDFVAAFAGTGVMFTCDAFGMHYCSEDPFDVDLKAILPHYR